MLIIPVTSKIGFCSFTSTHPITIQFPHTQNSSKKIGYHINGCFLFKYTKHLTKLFYILYQCTEICIVETIVILGETNTSIFFFLPKISCFKYTSFCDNVSKIKAVSVWKRRSEAPELFVTCVRSRAAVQPLLRYSLYMAV